MKSADDPLEKYFRGGYPVFATNLPDEGLRVADAVNRMFSAAFEELKNPPSAAIAAPYINPAGFAMIAEGLQGYQNVRLLIGAQPQPTEEHGDRGFDQSRVSEALDDLHNWLAAERDLTGFTYNDDALTRRLVDWLRSTGADGQPLAEVRRLTGRFLHGKAFIVEHPRNPAVLAGSSNLTAAGLAANAELNIGYPASENCELVQEWFNDLWEQAEPYPLADIYGARFDPHDPQVVFERMLLAVYGSLDAELQDEAAELGLTEFQSEGVARLMRFLDDLGGALLADEPGLGKTFMAGEIARRYASTGQKVLIVAPAAVRDSVWKSWLERYGISRRVTVKSYAEARIEYEALADHGEGEPSPVDVDLAFGDFQLIIADEAHHLRNAGTRQHKAITEITTAGARKNVLLVTATPINNSMRDLEHLLGLFLVSDDALLHKGIASWSRKVRDAIALEGRDEVVPEGFLYDLLDHLTVRRSRQFILDNPKAEGDTIRGADGTEQQVRFPGVELRPRIQWSLGQREKLLNDLIAHLDDDSPDGESSASGDGPALTFARYNLAEFSRDEEERSTLGRNRVGLLKCNILKRLESSPWAITQTLDGLVKKYEWFLDQMDGERIYTVKEMHLLLRSPEVAVDGDPADQDDLDEEDSAPDDLGDDELGRPLADFRVDDLRRATETDLVALRSLLAEAERITGPAGHNYTGTGSGDDKIRRLVDRLREIAKEAGEDGDKRKVIIFTEFADTAEYVHAALAAAVDAAAGDRVGADAGTGASVGAGDRRGSGLGSEDAGAGADGEAGMGAIAGAGTGVRSGYGGELGAEAVASGAGAGGADDALARYQGRIAPPVRSTAGASDDREEIIASFAPRTAGTATSRDRYDILVTTDVLAEGVNLHQAGKVINYDLPWNPMRLVQRHGRVDRIGSPHDRVQIDVFAPAQQLDEILKLMAKLEKKLGLAHAAIGVPETISDMPGGQGQLFQDGPDGLEIAKDILDGKDDWLRRRGSDTTSLGEQWRLALTRMQDPETVETLPAAAGSGFVSRVVKTPGFVFCTEILTSDGIRPKMVAVTAEPGTWQPTGNFDTSTLNCLRAAEPRGNGPGGAPRHLEDGVYPAVYTAWEQCRAHIVAENAQTLAERARQASSLPKPMRDAIAVIRQSSTLGAHRKSQLEAAFRTVPSRMVQNRVRTALRAAKTAAEDIEQTAKRLDVLAERQGLTARSRRSTPPRPITEDDIRLVAWMAIKPAHP